MLEDEKEFYEGEGTLTNIPIDDFFINQNNDIDSFGKCPGCDNETLNLGTRECECGYNLEHNIPDAVENIVEKTKNILKYGVCSCGNRMGVKSIMCKDCYGRNKINGNF